MYARQQDQAIYYTGMSGDVILKLRAPIAASLRMFGWSAAGQRR
jgi:hypothetical protein